MGKLVNFHFSDPIYFWLLLLIPLFWLFIFKSNYFAGSVSHLKKFIDAHLLSHLIKKSSSKNSRYKFLIFFSIIWFLLIFALSSPRWQFSEQKIYNSNSNLVILLDLSEHMNAKDILPSRIDKSKQIIADILHENAGFNIALVVFAKVSHIITPLTSDINTIKNILPYIDTDLPYIPGADLSNSIKEAAALFQKNGSSNHIALISSGNLENIDISKEVRGILHKKNIKISVIAVATEDGGPLVNQNGEFKKDQFGDIVISKLNKKSLQKIADNFGGKYFNANNNFEVAEDFLDNISTKKSINLDEVSKNKIWQEEYHWLIFIVMLLFFLLKRSFIFILPFLFITNFSEANILLNKDQKALKYFSDYKFEKASELFSDSYNSGVAKFKANNFLGAEEEFAKTADSDINARYNMGNSLFRQNKFRDAKDIYQKVLDEDPNHKKAKHNLKVAEEILKKNPEKDQSGQGEQKNNNDKQNKSQNKQDKQQRKNNKDNKQNESEDKQQKEADNKKDDKSENKKNKQKEEKNKDNKQNELENKQDKKQEKEDKSKNKENKKQEENNKQNESENKENNNSQKEEKHNYDKKLEATTQQILQRIESDPKMFLKKKFYFEERGHHPKN